MSDLVPTRVGMILFGVLIGVILLACPHTRGDDPNLTDDNYKDFTLSPHAWG